MAICPKCGSSNIHADKKGFSMKKGLVGGILLGGYGLLAGTVGSNKIRLTCLDCGCQFKPGECRISRQEPYIPVNDFSIPTSTPNINHKTSTEQKVKIDTLLKYRSVIKDSKVALLEDLQEEGVTHVIVPNGEVDALSKLQSSNGEIKRIISFKICK